MHNLSELSKSYYTETAIYEEFSRCEDKPNKIGNYLKQQIRGEHVLDLGCGTGKYLQLLDTGAANFTGLDKSEPQLTLAISKRISAPLICADGQHIPLPNNHFDVIYSCWMLGTIPEVKRESVLTEALRVLKPGGTVLLVENAPNSEFEQMRGHHLDFTTLDYLHWLKIHGFNIKQQINTWFDFGSAHRARQICMSIWGYQHFEFKQIMMHDALILSHTKTK